MPQYMRHKDIQLKQPLADVRKPNDGTNRNFVVPENAYASIRRFFDDANVPYAAIENPALYPKEKIDAALQRFEELSSVYCDEKPILMVTPFDPEALFDWCRQICDWDHIDPSYQAWIDSTQKEAEDYYQNNYVK